MSNESFDLDKIIYASKNTKITMKTKEKLDQLAAQVAIWDSENLMSANKENKVISSPYRPPASNRKVILNYHENLISPSSNSRKSVLEIRSSVKSKAAYFESLSTGETNEKTSSSNLFKTPMRMTNLEFPGVFGTPKSNIKTIAEENFEFPGVFDIPKSIIKTIPEENLELYEQSQDLDLPKIDERVLNEDFIEEFEGSFPSPPSILHDLSNSEQESIESSPTNIDIEIETTNTGLNTPKTLNKSWEGIDDSNEEFTRVSSMESFYDEFLSDFQKLSNGKEDTESLPAVIQKEQEQQQQFEQQKKIRRSLSFSEKVKYIEVSSDEELIDNGKKLDSSIRSVKSIRLNQSYYDDDNENDDNDDDDTCGDESWNDKSLDEITQDSIVTELMMKSCSLVDDLKVFSSSFDFKPGCSEHVKKCINILRNNLRYASIVESASFKPIPSNGIVGEVNISNMRLSVKTDYVSINYRSLVKLGYGSKIQKLSTLFHVVLMARSEGGSLIYESNTYTFVKRAEIEKHKLKYQDIKWIDFLENLNFSTLRSRFKLVFDLYCMTLEPNKSLFVNKSTPKRRTPMKKLFADSPCKQNIDSPITFTNVGTFRLNQSDMTSDNDDVIEKRIILPQNCPLIGDIQLTGSLSFRVTSQCRSRLNIYMEIGGVGAWAFRDCEITYRSIIGGRISKDTGEMEDIDVEILFCTFNGPANICDFQVCAKANTFSVLLDENSIRKKMTPVNRRLSTDGEKKCRFLAAAESREDANRWCELINIYHKSFLDWSQPIKLV